MGIKACFLWGAAPKKVTAPVERDLICLLPLQEVEEAEADSLQIAQGHLELQIIHSSLTIIPAPNVPLIGGIFPPSSLFSFLQNGLRDRARGRHTGKLFTSKLVIYTIIL